MTKTWNPHSRSLRRFGYKVVNPVRFGGIDAKTYRAMLDRHGLIAPQIDLGFSTGADMEKDLEACQILGAKFTEPAVGGGGGGRAAGGGAAAGRGPRAEAGPLAQAEDLGEAAGGPRRWQKAPRRTSIPMGKRPKNSA